MYIVGLTGGIGSGKSMVARLFSLLGIPVYDADSAARRLMREDDSMKQEIEAHFGKDIYPEGKLDPQKLASIVFHDPEKLALLNQLVHPATIEDARQWFSRQTAPYVVKEAALLFESGSSADVDTVIGIVAPTTLRIKRVMKRNKCSREEVIARMNRQMDESIKMRLCDHIIHNDDRHLVIPQVVSLHEKLSQLASNINPS